MATLLLTAGAAAFTGPGFFAATFGSGLAATLAGAAATGGAQLLGGVIDGALFAPDAPDTQGPRLDNLNVSLGREGEALKEVFGAARVPGIPVWATRLREVVSTQEVGGKGGAMGGGGGTQTTYSYFLSFAVAICDCSRGVPIDSIGAVWADKKPLDLGGYTYRLYTGTGTQEPDPLIEQVETVAPGFRDTAYIVFDDIPMERFGNRLPQIDVEVFRSSGGTLASTIAMVADEAGVTVDTAAVPLIAVDGYVIDRPMTDRERLAGLASPAQLDLIETASGFDLRPRYGEAAAVYQADDLIVQGRRGLKLTYRRDPDRANEILLTYVDRGRAYQPRVATARHPLIGDGGRSEAQTTMTLDAPDALSLAWLALVGPAISEFDAAFTLRPTEYARLAGDVIEIEDRDDVCYRVLITSTSWAGAIRCEGVACRADSVAVEAASDGLVINSTASVPTAPVLVFMDLPLLTGDELEHTPHVAGRGAVWHGVRIQRSTSGTNYFDQGVLSAEATMGAIGAALAAGPEDALDTLNTIALTLDSGGPLQSVSQGDIDRGMNALAVETASGEWEILQFRDASESGGVWTLSNLWRARRGTDGQMVHASGARAVLLDSAVEQLRYPVEDVGVSASYLFGPASRATDDALYATTSKAFDGVGLRPFSPTGAAGSREDDDDILITWPRRDRRPHPAAANPIPLSESSEAYEVDIFDTDDVTVLRTLTASAPSATYARADQVTDGLDAETSVTVEIFQISAVFGRGNPRRATLNVGAATGGGGGS